jgi:hypothetical protein
MTISAQVDKVKMHLAKCDIENPDDHFLNVDSLKFFVRKNEIKIPGTELLFINSGKLEDQPIIFHIHRTSGIREFSEQT